MTAPSKQIKFFKDEIEKIVSYIPYNGSETMQWLGVVSEIFNYRINLQNKMKKYDGIPENVKLEDASKRFLDCLTEKAKSTVKNKTARMRLFFNKFPTREFTTATVLKEDITSDRLYEILNDHLQSNASELLEGDWIGTMIVSRVIPQESKTNKNKPPNKQMALGNVTNLSNKKNYQDLEKWNLQTKKTKKAIQNLRITTVEVEQNCFAVAVLAVMQMSNNLQEGNILSRSDKIFTIIHNSIKWNSANFTGPRQEWKRMSEFWEIIWNLFKTKWIRPMHFQQS